MIRIQHMCLCPRAPMLWATSLTILNAHDQSTSSTLIGGKGIIGPSLLYIVLEGPMEYNRPLLKYTLWTGAIGEHFVGRCVLYPYRQCSIEPYNFFLNTNDAHSKNLVLLCCWTLLKFWKWRELKKYHLLMTKSSLSRHLMNMKVLLTSMAFKMYTTLPLISMINCFYSMSKRKMNTCTMNCHNRLRSFSETLTIWHWMSSVNKWLCKTCFKQQSWTLILVKQFAHLTAMRT